MNKKAAIFWIRKDAVGLKGRPLMLEKVMFCPLLEWMGEVLAASGIDRILLETDAPSLAPTPHRGKRNEPSYVEYVCRKIADIHDLSFEQVDSITTASAKQLFGIN